MFIVIAVYRVPADEAVKVRFENKDVWKAAMNFASDPVSVHFAEETIIKA